MFTKLLWDLRLQAPLVIRTIKVGVLDVWIISFQKFADDLILFWNEPERGGIRSAHRLF